MSDERKEPETHLLKEKAGDLEVLPLREISYDLLNTIIACRGYLEQLDDELKDSPNPVREKIENLRQGLFKAQKLLQERIEEIR